MKYSNQIKSVIGILQCIIAIYNIHVYNCTFFFRIEKNHPGIVFVRDYASSDDISINIMKSGTMQNLQPAQIPIVISQKGLDAQRQWYLYQEVAPCCQNKKVCPKPCVPMTIIKMDAKQMYC